MKFFEFVKYERFELFPVIGSNNRLYLDLSTNKLYHYNHGKYLLVSANAFEEDTSPATLDDAVTILNGGTF